ncbi:membrane fusion protein (multidrug efflux system) [Chitinophaga skermanii]|uniref:Membrane fusion protein (Multidrug efflux system) n=1 Tax=Chitinophaga skermanii TaxID=331697 RepID=A0A327R5W8_9BACT|nr:HlyD family secretion protein [Chitinophaga skermanii]RAJ10983.1 membrane fusion protein (multidrug efflux system) [Chitinophaga skermanii]
MENTSNNPRKGKLVVRIIFILILVVGAIFGIKTWMYARHHETTDNAQVEGHAAPVIARVSGYVKALDVQDYGNVKLGDTLLTIDDAEYKIALQQAEADYQQAQADLLSAQASLGNSQANLRVAETNAQVALVHKNKAAADLKRDQNLFNDQAITNRQLDDTKAASMSYDKQYQSSLDQIDLAKSAISVTSTKIGQAQAILASKAALVEQARLKLTYTHITANITGKIGKKMLEAGQYVQAGQSLFTIVDDKGFYIVANFKETQLAHIFLGQEAEIEIDSYPGLVLKGKVADISRATGAKFSLLPPDNATGNFVKIVQRVPVKIIIENADQYMDKLRSGLSVDVALKY